MSTEAPPPSLDPNAPPPGAPPSIDPNAPPAAPAESWTKEWLKPDGSFDHKALEKAPDELKKSAKSFERYKTVEEWAKGHVNLESSLGKKGIVDPLPDNATQAQKDERTAMLRKVNGAPDKPEGYGLAKPEGVPDQLWDAAFAGEVAAIAHKHALSPAAVKELSAAELKYTQAAVEANKQAEVQWFAGQDKLIREALGKEGVDFAKGSDLAQRAGRKFGIDPTNPLMKNASVFMLLTRIGRAMGEDNLKTGSTDGLGPDIRMTAEQAEAAASDIIHNKKNPDNAAYWTPGDPRNASVKERVTSLMAIATRDRPRRTR